MNNSGIAQRQCSKVMLGILAILFLMLGLHASIAGSATWKSSPATGDWNTATNWTPTTAPNGSSDIATLGTSSNTSLSLSANTVISGIVFNSNANSFTTTVSSHALTISGTGVTNNSVVTQDFVSDVNSVIDFTNSATAGSGTHFTGISGSPDTSLGGFIRFKNSSNAATATFTVNLSSVQGYEGVVGFWDTSSAAGATFNVFGGVVEFRGTANADHASFTVQAGISNFNVEFDENSSAAEATFVNQTGTILFWNSSTAADATITTEGGTSNLSGQTIFASSASAGNATLVVNGGTTGGVLQFQGNSTGGTASIQINGNGSLDISSHYAPGVTVGSIAGDGTVFLGARALIVGGNETSTAFSGLIRDSGMLRDTGGSLSKIGTGALTLSSANTYPGGTEISAGTILVNNTSGSGTGSGAVLVDNGATLGGTGAIQLGNGATLTNNGSIAPGNSPGQLNVNGSIKLGYPSNLSVEIGGTTPATQYDVLNKIDNAALTLKGKLTVSLINAFTPQSSDTFTIVTTQTTLSGKFTNVKDGGRVNTTDGTGSFQVNYTGLNNVVFSNFGPPLSPSQNQNISTRVDVGTGENVAIGGFIITGSAQKKVIIRGIGPSLSGAGLQNVLANPTLELHGSSGVIATNDDWKEHQSDVEATGLQPTNDAESAIVATLDPGTYTVILAGKNGGGGIGLIEVYDLDPAADAELANISTRGFVGTGDNVMIGGIIVGPNNTNAITVVVRAIGPSLSGSGIANPLLDPVLELHDGNGALLALNNNWKDIQQADIDVTGLSPTNDAESSILASLAPGNYTAVVVGANSTSGVGLAEVYEVQ